MEQKLPSLSANYPWLVAQNLDGTGDQTFYTIHDQPSSRYQCRIPKLLGRLIRGYSHGWVLLSNNNNNMWSVWNPVTSKIINLPPLILNKSESIGQCCLSSPPDDPVSVLLLTLTGKPTFVYCQLGSKRNNMLRWKKMPYNRQLKGILGHYDGFLQCPTCYDGKIYALSNDGKFVIHVDIIVKDGEIQLKLLLLGTPPYPSPSHTFYPMRISLLKGTCTGLFYIAVAFNEVARKTIANVYLFKWVMTTWEEMVDIKDTMFFVDLARDYSVYYTNEIASELGGYIHIRDETGKIMYSYDVEDKTISMSSMAYPTSHVSLWECRLKGDHEDFELTLDSKKDDKIIVTSVMDDEVELNESRLLNLPFHLLETIMRHCIGVEYMRFRATCKSCHLAAPSLQWNDERALRRLHGYSAVSPWLLVVNKNRGVITFTDPIFGDKYFMKRPRVSIRHERILCSRFGWLLYCSDYSILVFFNPFTGDIRKLPPVQCSLGTLCFSAPPTSPNCMVVGFTGRSCVCIHFVAREQSWVMIRLNNDGITSDRFYFPTFSDRDLYVLGDTGEVYVFKRLFELKAYYYEKVVGASSCEGEYFLVKRDRQFLLVVVGESRECVEVFKLNISRKEWEKIDCLGRYMIYINGTTCLCIEAKAPEMQNKIFFPRLDSKNGKIVFYSLETRMYHRFDASKNIEEIVGVGRENVFPHAWIEPTWS